MLTSCHGLLVGAERSHVMVIVAKALLLIRFVETESLGILVGHLKVCLVLTAFVLLAVALVITSHTSHLHEGRIGRLRNL